MLSSSNHWPKIFLGQQFNNSSSIWRILKDCNLTQTKWTSLIHQQLAQRGLYSVFLQLQASSGNGSSVDMSSSGPIKNITEQLHPTQTFLFWSIVPLLYGPMHNAAQQATESYCLTECLKVLTAYDK